MKFKEYGIVLGILVAIISILFYEVIDGDFLLMSGDSFAAQAIKKSILKAKYHECLIGGGEDYELCFTASKSQRSKIQLVSKNIRLPLTIIGKVTKRNILFKENGVEKKINIKGFDHFS